MILKYFSTITNLFFYIQLHPIGGSSLKVFQTMGPEMAQNSDNAKGRPPT